GQHSRNQSFGWVGGAADPRQTDKPHPRSPSPSNGEGAGGEVVRAPRPHPPPPLHPMERGPGERSDPLARKKSAQKNPALCKPVPARWGHRAPPTSLRIGVDRLTGSPAPFLLWRLGQTLRPQSGAKVHF